MMKDDWPTCGTYRVPPLRHELQAAFGAEGCEFEPHRPDQYLLLRIKHLGQ